MDDAFAAYGRHSPASDPGPFADRLPDRATGDPATLCRLVQNLLLHDWGGRRLYGRPPPGLDFSARTTAPAAERLQRILAADPRPLDAPRPPFERSVGTCRDFALLLACFCRQAGRAARLRCGFADYLSPGRREDHWICEIAAPESGGWRRADAQFDPAHCAAYAVDFDPSDLPAGRFLAADEAWRAWRAGEAPAERFGHGDEGRGSWFLFVNLARDRLALADRLTSPWDRWREVEAADRTLSAPQIEAADRWAATAIEAPEQAPEPGPPPWSSATPRRR